MRYLLICLAITAGISYGQEPEITNTVSYTPESPQASGFVKYAENPVNYSAGLPNISIPIFNLPLRGYTLPINLSYHAGGIKVDEIASNVGLGWVLNAGGVITVKALSHPDTYKPVMELPSDFDLGFQSGYSSPGDCDGTGYGWMVSYFQPVSETAGFCTAGGYMDLDPNFEPDKYYYTLPGMSGELTRTKNDLFVPIPTFNTIKFNFIEDTGFTVVDEQGVYYEFFSIEEVEEKTFSYYLTKIISPEGDSIMFEYELEEYIFYHSKSSSISFVDNRFQDTRCFPQSDFSFNNFNSHSTRGQRLASIYSSNGYSVQFIYNNSERLDLPETHKLDSIKIHYSLYNTTQTLSQFSLYHHYLNSTSGNEHVASLGYRLMLDSVQRAGEPSYKLKYNEDIPSRLSNQQDFWGYANNNPASTSIPDMPLYLFYTGADRSADITRMMGGSLEEIQYPTGGKSKYIMEPHEYFFHTAETVGQDSVTLSCNPAQTQNLHFTIPDSINGRVKVFFELATDTQAGISIYGGAIVYFIPVENLGWTGEDEATLNPGNYTLTINTPPGTEGSTVKLWWRLYSVDTVNQNRVVGGLRLKKIIDYDEYLNVTKTREFTYNIPETTKSSAKAEKIPTAHGNFLEGKSWRPAELDECNYYEIECHYFTAHNVDVSYEARPVNTTVSYTHVTETITEPGKNWGKTEYRFSHVTDFFEAYDLDLMRATANHLVEKTFKDASGQVVRRESHTYDFEYQDHSYYDGYRFFMGSPEVWDPPQGQEMPCNAPHTFPYEFVYPGEFFILTYKPASYFVKKVQDVSVEYATTDSTLNQVDYFYGPDFFLSEIHSYAGQDTIKRYPSYMNFRSRNIQRPSQVSARLVRNGNIFPQAHQQVYYSQFDNRLRVDSIQVQTFGPGSTVITYYHHGDTLYYNGTARTRKTKVEKVDANNNVLQVLDATGVRRVYRWGYDNRYVVAEALGTEYKDIAFTSFEYADEKGGWQYTYNPTTSSRTGKLAQSMSGSITKDSLDSSKAYEVSFWMQSPGTITVNSQTPTTIKEISGWVLKSIIVEGVTLVTLAGTGILDELRVHPAKAQMTTYTYDPGVGITSVTDPNLLTTSYSYEEILNRLELIKDSYGNVMSQFIYNYLNQP